VWLWLRFVSQREKSRNQLIEKALELNKDINSELFLRPKKDASVINRRLLVSGISLVCFGLAAFTVLLVLTNISYASFAFLLLFPGLGFLIAHRLIAKDLKKGQAGGQRSF
jgi:hypothetical protein